LGSIVHLLKYKQKFAVERILALLLNVNKNLDINFCSYDFSIPVPLHRSRLRHRGFNQAVVWGNVLHKRHNVPLKRLVLQRTVATLPQVQLQGKERTKNVRNAFKVKDPTLLQNKTILLLDDVYTTGATMNECARVLKDAGALRVDGFVIARAV
jgi:ComF family protein